MIVEPTQDFKKVSDTPTVDPSVQYADALMNGDEVVTVKTLSGQNITYRIGYEHNR